MTSLENQKFCNNCIYPVGLNIKNPLTGEILQFSEQHGHLLCEVCAKLLSVEYFPSREYFNLELSNYLDKQERILFAYSGGLDSTAVLYLLTKECKKRGIKLETFTIVSGVKGRIAHQNIKRVISYFGIKEHFIVDITNKIQNDPAITNVTGKPMTTLEVFHYCANTGILPCGKICNTMMDEVYSLIMQERDYTELFTGGDTPKKDKNGKYSLFWRKPIGVVIVRGGYAFNLTKEKIHCLVKQNNIPWVHPKCGGYDTDCLAPGVLFANLLGGSPNISLQEVLQKFPIVLEYLTERVRFGTINREEALYKLTHIDIANSSSCIELNEIFRAIAQK